MKILITGCKGMLGTDLMNVLSAEAHDVVGSDVQELDITNLEATLAFIKRIEPDVVINCSAYTNVDACETEINLAYKVNSIGPRNLAIAAQEVGAKLVHISTDYVFDGNKGEAYLEGDFVNPLSVYGKSKLDGENHVKSLMNKYFIVRTQWLYGVHGKNFVKTMINLSKERTELMVVNDQFGSPTHTLDLCHAISELINTKEYGTYHITNSGIVSWFQFTKDIMELIGKSDITVKPCTTAEFPRPAKRPAYSPLKNYNWELCGFKPLRDYKEALSEYLELEKIYN